jgi:hypothetical protein
MAGSGTWHCPHFAHCRTSREHPVATSAWYTPDEVERHVRTLMRSA